MKKCLLMSFMVFFVVNIFFTFVDRAEAIPAFARKYKTSCTTCHVAIPKRNAFGEAFRRNGYVMPQGDVSLIKQEPIPLGSEGWKEVFPDAIWPGFLPAEFPLSAYIHQRFVWETAESKSGDRVEFDMPHEFEIFIGGTLGDAFSFFGEWIMFEKGKNAPGLKRFFFQFNDVIGPDNLFDIRVGRLEPGITEGYVDNNRITLEHAMTLDYKATGKWRPRDQQSGIEFRGIVDHRFQYIAGVVNGEKKTISDATDEKDFYGRLGYKFGGLSLDGVQQEELTSLKQTDNWADNALTLGAYFYQGNNMADSNSVDNNFTRYGFDIHGNYNRVDLFAGAILGTDDNPIGFVTGSDKEKEVNSTAWFVEGQYLFYPWLIAGVRIGGAKSDQNDVDIDDFTTISPNLTILARANIRFTIEALYKSGTVGGQEIKSGDKFTWLKVNVLFVL